MRILILSQNPWRKDNSFGNTYSNIFSKVRDVEIAHIYLLGGMPDYEPVVTRYYQIEENAVIKTFFSSRNNKGVGKEVFVPENTEKNNNLRQGNKSIYNRLLNFGKRHHWMLLFWAREFAWKYGNINYEGLISFVKDFKPDIFFLPFENVYNTNRLAMYIVKRCNVPMVAYMAMDHYSLKRVSFNPLFWIDRLVKRSMIRGLTGYLEKWYVISDRLKKELDKGLHIKSQVLYKIPEVSRERLEYSAINHPVRFLYTGNIYANRWKTLKLLAKALKLNSFGRLDIYTASPINSKIDKALNIEGVSTIHKPVSQEEVVVLQNKADVLVHAESFDITNKLLVRCAISTKIMDYLSVGRCIMAIGPKDIASIEYLRERNLALVASDKKEVYRAVADIKANESVLFDFARRGKDYINKELNAQEMRQYLYDDLSAVINHYNLK